MVSFKHIFYLKRGEKCMSDFCISPANGSRRVRKRIGRGHGSGNGKTAGKGHKGQKARSGGSIRWGFEGGQMPLQRRVPKRGFNNIFAKKIISVNLADLNCFAEGSSVDESLLRSSGIIKRKCDMLKILGKGELKRKLNVKANLFSGSARSKIEQIGGTVEVIGK